MQLVNRADQERQTSSALSGGGSGNHRVKQKPHKIRLKMFTQKEELATGDSDTSWLRKFLPSNFFTPKVVKNREDGLQTSAKNENKRHFEQVLNVYSRSPSTPDGKVTLRLDAKTRSFAFYRGCHILLPVSQHRLVDATSLGGEMVSLVIDTHTLRFKRPELRAAFQALETKLGK